MQFTLGRLLLAIAALVALANAQTCIVTGFGNTFDLNPLKGTVYKADNTRYTAYTEYIAVCGDVVTGVDGCASNAAVCEKGSDSAPGTTLGLNPATLVASSNASVDMTYTTAGSCYSVKITFTCNPAAGNGEPVYSFETTCNFVFNWPTSLVCADSSQPPSGQPGQPPSSGSSTGLSGGDIFLILFFCGGFLYVVIGMGIKYQRYEARGIEMIPNIETWRDLPYLIKDGCVFTWQKTTDLFKPK